MESRIFELVFLVLPFVIASIVMSVFGYFSHKQHVKWNTYISDAKTKIENAGFKFNHSYRLTNKLTNAVVYLRIYSIKYSPDNKQIMAHAYMVSKSGEIGEWYDDYKFFLEVHERWTIEDCGEWNPKK